MKEISLRTALIIFIVFILTVGRWLFIPLVLVIAFIVYSKRNHGQSEENPGDEPFFNEEPERPVGNVRPPQEYDPDPDTDHEHIQSKSFTDYPKSVDPWDVKDEKPPWEL